MKRFRSVIFWLHLALGVSAAAIVLIMSATGVLLTYQRQIQTWADTRGLDGGAPAANVAPLPVEHLLAAVATERPGEPTAVRWRAKPDAPVEVVFGREGTVFVNGYTGAVLGTGAEGVRSFFRTMTDWHRWLARSGDDRAWGRAVTGAANLAFLFIVVSGFYLWWPRNWTRAAFRNVLLFRGGLRAKARDFNWHNVIGFWSLVPLVVVVFSGVVISYPWAGDLVYRAVGDTPPARRGSGPPPAPAAAPADAGSRAQRGGVAGADARSGDRAAAGRNGRQSEAPAEALDLSGVEPLIAVARASEPDWRIITMQLEPADGGVSFSVDRGNGAQPHKRATLVLDAASAEVLKAETFADATAGRQARSILRFAHTGEIGGLLGQTLAGLVSFGALILVWTGLALSLRRLGTWWRRRTNHAAAASPVRSIPRRERREEVRTAARGRLHRA